MSINKYYKNNKPVRDKEGRLGYRVRVSYTDLNGNYKQAEKIVFGLAEAQMTERQLMVDYKERKDGVLKNRLTVNELIDEYLSYHSIEVKETSLDSTAKVLRLRVRPYLGECRLDKLTQKRLAEWKITISGLNLSDRTKQGAYSIFVALLNYAVKMQYIPKNPLSVLGNFKKSSNAEEKPQKLRYYTVEQFQKFITVAQKHCKTVNDWGFYMFFLLAFFTGCRKGELNALRWSDIEGNVIHVRRQIAQKLKGIKDKETTTKTSASNRDLQVPPQIVEKLKEHKERQKKAAGDLFTEDFRVCGGVGTLRDTTIDKRNRQYAEEAGLPHITIHEYRHSHASLLANNNINIQEVARRLGHSNVNMTWQIYSHLYPSQEEKALEILKDIELD